MTATYLWHQPKVDPFDDAEFYEQGSIVTITNEGRSVTVDRDGRSELHYDDRVFRSVDDFRAEFPDGETPETPEDNNSWWENNGWFDLYDGAGNHIEDDDHVAHGLAEAVADAEHLLGIA